MQRTRRSTVLTVDRRDIRPVTFVNLDSSSVLQQSRLEQDHAASGCSIHMTTIHRLTAVA
jgi:hypothetical protein